MFEPSPVKKVRSSIFLKFLLVFIAGLAVYSISMKWTHDLLFMKPRFPKIQRMAVHSAQAIAGQLGTPPDYEAAESIRDTFEVFIRYESADNTWTTSQLLPAIDDVRIPVFPQNSEIYAGFDKGLLVILPIENGRLLIALHKHDEGMQHAANLNLIISLSISAMIIFGMFMAVRHLARPIKVLNEGVSALSAGRFEFNAQTKRSDELGRLIVSFSAMTTHIKEMIDARDRLLLDVSHELRSPLTRIKLSLEMMHSCPEKSEISTDIHEMETMITELLETERLSSSHGTLELTEVDIYKLLKDLQNEFKMQKPGVLLETVPDQMLIADKKRLRILLSNLLANAIKYSPDHGNAVRISGALIEDRLRLIIQDSGTGIPSQELPFVFEPFYRVDKSRTKETGGYGLGLSLSRRIAEAHGGTLVLENVDGMGVRAVLEIPTGK